MIEPSGFRVQREKDRGAWALDRRADYVDGVPTVRLVPDSEPSPTVTGNAIGHGVWQWRRNDQTGPPVNPDWPAQRPATTIAGRLLVPDPGANANRFNNSTKSRNDGYRVTIEEAAILQGFPPDYPWRAEWPALAAQLTFGFGPEYERTVSEAPSRREAEAELRERRERHDEFDIRPLSPDARERYAQEWEATQARFVDDPEAAIRDADDLIQQVMRERGYPVEDFDQRAADLSVDHPDVVEHYREGHGLAERSADGTDDDVTEARRQAMVHYRVLFEELLVADAGDRVETGR